MKENKMKNTKRVTIKDLMEEVENLQSKSQEVEILKKRIVDLEKDIKALKAKNGYQSTENPSKQIFPCRKCDETLLSVNELKKHDKINHTLTQIKCNSCESVFDKNSDLENHLEEKHNIEKFQCKKCDKTFALKWRLTIHQNIHNSKNLKKCHYFNNMKTCPFEKIGCMFDHVSAGECQNGEVCKIKLCSFEHKTIRSDEDNSKDDNIEAKQNEEEIIMTEEEKSFDLYVKVNFPDILSKYLENKRKIHCYYCSYSSKSPILRNIEDEVYNHLQTMHPEVMRACEEIAFEKSYHEEFHGLFSSD